MKQFCLTAHNGLSRQPSYVLNAEATVFFQTTTTNNVPFLATTAQLIILILSLIVFSLQIFDKIVDNAQLVLQIDTARLAADDFKVK